MMKKVFRTFLLAIVALGAAAQDFSSRFEEIKQSANKAELYRFLYDLPKGGDLHNHFTLSPSPAQWWKAATARGVYFSRVKFNNCPDSTEPHLLWINIPRSQFRQMSPCRKAEYLPLADLDEAQRRAWISAMILDQKGEGRNEFFEVIVQRLRAFARDPELLRMVFLEYAKAAAAEGVRYLETQVTPVLQTDDDGNAIPPGAVGSRWRRFFASPEMKATGVEVRFQYSVLRFAPDAEKRAAEAWEFVAQNRDLWTAVNLVGREDNDKGHALRFLPLFRALRRQYPNVRLSLHGGEKDSPGREVRETLLLGAERIGHGINLISDPDTMLLLRNGRTLIESNLVSNQLLEYTPDVRQHPFIEYLRFGIPVCLNTDDPGVWDSNLTDEYFTAVSTFGLTWEEIVRLGRNSLEYSFLEPATKERLLQDYAERIGAFEAKYSAEEWRLKLLAVKPAVSGYARRTLGIE